MRVCTHAVVQCLLEPVQQVVVVKWEELLNGGVAEHAVLVDVDQCLQLPPANHTLRREDGGWATAAITSQCRSETSRFVWLASAGESDIERWRRNQSKRSRRTFEQPVQNLGSKRVGTLSSFCRSKHQSWWMTERDRNKDTKTLEKHFGSKWGKTPGPRSEPWGTPEKMPELVAMATPGLFDLWTEVFWLTELRSKRLIRFLLLTTEWISFGVRWWSYRQPIHQLPGAAPQIPDQPCGELLPAGDASLGRHSNSHEERESGRPEEEEGHAWVRWSSSLLLLYVLPHPPPTLPRSALFSPLSSLNFPWNLTADVTATSSSSFFLQNVHSLYHFFPFSFLRCFFLSADSFNHFNKALIETSGKETINKNPMSLNLALGLKSLDLKSWRLNGGRWIVWPVGGCRGNNNNATNAS